MIIKFIPETEQEKEKYGKVAEEPGEYNTKENTNNEPYVNQKIKEVTQKIFIELSDYTRIDLWRQKSEVLQQMRKTIKINLLKNEEFKIKLESLTNKIIKLSKNIFMF